jgi:hypothetical protein
MAKPPTPWKFDPTRTPPGIEGPSVDYRLARKASLASLRNGSLDTGDVCDAHPELMRAGKNIGIETDEPCPICSHDSLRHVRYVYGEQLRHNNGRVVYPAEWLDELIERYDHFTCYVVEVCVDCAWNHLIRAFSAGRDFSHPNGNGSKTARTRSHPTSRA